jgi:nitroreductase
MDFLELAKKRKSTYEFTDKKIKDSDIQKILEAGRWGPSFLNLRPWKFVVIKNKEKIEKIIQTANYGMFHTTPSLIIAVLLDKKACQGPKNNERERELKELEGNISLGMCAMNLLLEATDLGINTAILTPNENEIIKILKTSSNEHTHLLLALGYEKKDTFQKKRTRKDLKDLALYPD